MEDAHSPEPAASLAEASCITQNKLLVSLNPYTQTSRNITVCLWLRAKGGPAILVIVPQVNRSGKLLLGQ